MVGLLGFVNEKLEEIGIPYEFGEWTKTVSYPYFVGSFQETDYRFEDNCTIGAFTLDGWSRESKIDLAAASDKIRDAFQDVQAIRDDTAFFICFGGSMPMPTGEADLFKISITLYTYEWKGE